MAKRSRKSQKTPRRRSRKLRPSHLLISLFVIVALVAGTKLAHYFGDAQTRERIERGTAFVIDFARESSLLPDEAVFWLDELALYLPFVYGNAIEPGTALETTELTLAGTPIAEQRLTLLENDGYLVGYDESRGNPAWCAYKIFPPQRTEAPERPENFETDYRTRARVPTEAYMRSGYDRGHMAPNHAIALCYGESAQKETFLMSNIVPQKHGLNAGIWKALEQRLIKRYTRNFGDIWVLCGPVYTEVPLKRLAGTSRRGILPAVPDAFFLIVTDREEHSGALRTLAFIVPHEDNPKNNPKLYLTSIDSIEEKTGLDFFSLLDENVQSALETPVAKTIW